MYLLYILLSYRADCKKIGKENLAVPLRERLELYVILFLLPLALALLRRW